MFAVLILSVGLVAGSMIQSFWQTAFVKTSGDLEDPLEAWSEAEVIIWQYNSTFYASRNMSTLMVIDLASNDTAVLDNALGNVTILGGQVFVKAGTYGAITANVRNWTRLTIEKNATGITASTVAGGTCIIEDWNVGRIRWYRAGALVWDTNMDSGTLTATNAVFSTWMNSTSINSNSYYLGNHSLGFVQSATFIINYNATSGYYQSWHGANSTLASQGTNASAVINNAIGNLTVGRTWQETVYLKGNITITNSIVVSNWTRLLLDGTVTLANNANCDMIKNANPSTTNYNVVIEGGLWLGNRGTQSAGCWINFTTTNGAPYPYTPLFLKNLYVFDIYDTAIWIKYGESSVVWMDNVDATTGSGTGYGLYLYGATDSLISHSHFGGGIETGGGAIYIYGGGGLSSWTDIRTDGPVSLIGVHQLTWTGFTIDCYNRDMHGLTLYNSKICQISNGIIRAQSNSGYNTKYAIYMSDSSNNTISNIYCGRPQESIETQRWAYGVYEDGTANRNIFIGINAFDALTAGIKTSGANSHANLCWNATAWLP